jgi:hypothetical protein
MTTMPKGFVRVRFIDQDDTSTIHSPMRPYSEADLPKKDDPIRVAEVEGVVTVVSVMDCDPSEQGPDYLVMYRK